MAGFRKLARGRKPRSERFQERWWPAFRFGNATNKKPEHFAATAKCSGVLFGLGRGCCLGGFLLGEFPRESFGGGDLFGLAGRLGFGRGIALAGLDPLGAGVGRFENTGGLTAAIAQVVELGATHLAALQDFY